MSGKINVGKVKLQFYDRSDGKMKEIQSIRTASGEVQVKDTRTDVLWDSGKLEVTITIVDLRKG